MIVVLWIMFNNAENNLMDKIYIVVASKLRTCNLVNQLGFWKQYLPMSCFIGVDVISLSNIPTKIDDQRQTMQAMQTT